MYLVEKDLQRATATGRVSGCPAACMCSVHMYNLQGAPCTSSYAPIVLVIEDTDVQRGYNIDNICLRCSCDITSGCCAWMPYHIEAAIQYAPPPGDAIVTIRWVLNILTQDVVHTVTC